MYDTPIIDVDEQGMVWINAMIIGNVLEGVHDLCGTREVYYDLYDASFCPKCNLWLENACGDPHCDYCSIRQNTQLEIKN